VNRNPTLGLLAAAVLAIGATDLSAQVSFITGTVVDAFGAVQPSVNIAVENNGSGGDPDVFNGGTNLFGNFNTTVDPAGTYDVVFRPAAPNLITRIIDVPISGTLDMGTVVMDLGVILSGRLLDPLGLPVDGVNLDLVDLDTGNQVELTGDKSDALGQFAFAIPTGNFELRLNATPVPFPVLASQAFDITVTGDTNLGDITMQEGFKITTIVQQAGFVPVENADTDTVDVLTGDKLYTPGDNTDAFGLVTVTVPAGNYHFQICAPPGSQLVDHEITPVLVAANVNLGLTVMEAGMTLTGTVVDSGGQPIAGIDIDVEDSTTLLKQLTCNDNTNGAGVYSVVVPAGTWNVRFTPKFSQPYGTAEVFNVAVAGTTTVNGQLPDCAFSTQYGAGVAGAGGLVPLLSSSGGAPRLGNPDYTVELSNGLGGAVAPVMLGFGAGALPFKGGVLLIDLTAGPFLLFNLPLSGPAGVPGAGSFSLPAAVPVDPVIVGFSIYVQFFVPDPSVPLFGLAFSNGLQITYCD